MLIYNLKINKSKTFKIITGIISIIIVLLFIIGVIKIFKLAKHDGNIYNQNDIANIDSSNYTNILKVVHENIDNFVGKKITFSGYIYRVYDLNENQFVLARNMVINPELQTVVVGFLCESERAKDFADGTWVSITGEITKGDYHGEMPIIKVIDIEECKKVENEYVYPPDENYLQTPEL